MSGRARLGVAREALGAWLLGGLCFWALGGLCGLGATAPGAGAGGAPGTPRPCQAPQQWEGRQVLYRQSSGRNSRALLSYDGLNQRVRVLDERKALIPCKRLFEYILLYKDGVMFQIEQATKQCSKITLTEPWDPLDIPQNATFEDQYSIGGPQEQITVQEWSDRKSARSYETWIGIYTVKDCYPVQETFTKNYSVILSTRFFDIQLGIKDPSVFIPPSTCQAAQPERMSEDCSW
ncbi:mammalian ependymin-related protein 1 [Zalophus californianus]|uniref:Mammalian ependymin-related protein 1 n=1 Tax=Zalophus californianus TaxID=9704 RepID=A0A6P9F0H9_ZALCA|nr:mammalian ependymin-related protein 1 [Eumetopias jubatus]XP_035579294.1 mammalian ependymin-related protein 1 [Zalophus californianus]